MENYTKQEVQEFLGTTNNKNNDLINSLATRGIVAKTNGKRGANLLFELDKPMADPIQQEFGFRPTMPNYTRILLEAFEDNGGRFVMTWKDISSFVWETQGVRVHYSNLSRAYKELFDNGKTIPDVQYIILDVHDNELTAHQEVLFGQRLAAYNAYYGEGYNAYQLTLNSFGYSLVKLKQISAF